MKQQKKYHLALAEKTDNPKEISEFINATYDRKLSTIDIGNQNQMNEVVNLVSYWRTLMGCTKDVSPAQIRIEAEYIVQEYPTITIQDVKLAMNYCIKQKLDIKLPYVLNFSTLLMGQIIESYKTYKAEQINKIGDQVTPPAIAYDLTPAQKADNMKDIIRSCAQHIDEGCKERFYFRTVYDFLRRTGRLQIDDKLAKDGKEYVEKKLKAFQPSTSGTLRALMPGASVEVKKQRELATKQYKLDFLLINYFQTHKLEDVINSITEKDYREEEK